MTDDYNRNSNVKDNVARALATLATLLALIALGWAIKADNHAAEAENQATQSSQSTDAVRDLDTGTNAQ